MFSKILVPVDLNHPDEQMKALKAAAMLAEAEGAEITLLNIGGFSVSHPARNAQEFVDDLSAFAKSAEAKLGASFNTVSRYSHDPAAELDGRIQNEIEASGYDLLVMASHMPGILEYIFGSNAGYLATHAKISVFVVR